jgi:5-methylcytosine-specific restriction protein A
VAHKVNNGRALTADEFSGGEQTVVRRLKQLGFEVQSTRNPDWVRDEIILACELVVENNWHELRPRDPRVIELSELLQRANIHPPESRAIDFRNPNGVARKTADIATHHPDYEGKPTKGGRLDEEVLGEFIVKPAELVATAKAIRESILEGHIQQLLIAELDLDLDAEADEGRVLERRHIARERDPKIRAKKIAAVRRATGSVACEACGFDFAKTYGTRGIDFIECHHRVPLHVSGQTKTKLADLVLLCSNCHRMIHRQRPWLTFEGLVELVEMNRS